MDKMISVPSLHPSSVTYVGSGLSCSRLNLQLLMRVFQMFLFNFICLCARCERVWIFCDCTYIIQTMFFRKYTNHRGSTEGRGMQGSCWMRSPGSTLPSWNMAGMIHMVCVCFNSSSRDITIIYLHPHLSRFYPCEHLLTTCLTWPRVFHPLHLASLW